MSPKYAPDQAAGQAGQMQGIIRPASGTISATAKLLSKRSQARQVGHQPKKPGFMD